MIHWLLHKVRLRTFLSLGLLLAVYGCVAWGFTGLIRGLDGGVVWTMGIIGLFVGWAFARLRISGWWAAGASLFLGIGGMFFSFGRLGSPIGAMLGSLTALLVGVLRWKQNGPPDTTPLLLAAQEFSSRISVIWESLIRWFYGVFHGILVIDSTAVNMVWGFVFWLLIIWAVWASFRLRQPLLGVLPLGVLLAGSLNYTRSSPFALVPLIGATLLLMTLVRYDDQEQKWVKKRVDFAEDIPADLGVLAVILVLALMSISAVVPSLSVRKAIQLGRSIIQTYQNDTHQVAESLGLKPIELPFQPRPQAYNAGLPQEHLLGGGPELTREVVMVIITGDLPPMPSIEYISIKPPHYYWRSMTFNYYTGSGWQSSPSEKTTYPANVSILESLPPENDAFRLVRQDVSMVTNQGGPLYAAGSLITADSAFQVSWRAPVGSVMDMFGATIKTGVYQADSYITTPSIPQLETAPTEYPPWIRDRYLQLPSTLPQRVIDLAKELTANAVTPYEKAHAIESYLRTYPYTLEIGKPPPGVDVADYFLFDLKKGYCDYYATSMVVLARAVGVPARVVTGFASGSYDSPNARYIITQADSHSWVEVFFPGIGWVEFEPTAAQPTIERSLSGPTQVVMPEIKPAPRFIFQEWLRSRPWLDYSFGLVIILLLGSVLWFGSDPLRLDLQSPQKTILQLYHRLFRRSRALARSQSGDTPNEFAARLQARLETLRQRLRRRTTEDPGVKDIHTLTNLYTKTVYSPHKPNPRERAEAIRSWQRLRSRLWWANITDRILTISNIANKNTGK